MTATQRRLICLILNSASAFAITSRGCGSRAATVVTLASSLQIPRYEAVDTLGRIIQLLHCVFEKHRRARRPGESFDNIPPFVVRRDIPAIKRRSLSNTCVRISDRTGTAISAAAVGVGARGGYGSWRGICFVPNRRYRVS